MGNVLALALLLVCGTAFAHDADGSSALGFDERPGALIPLDLRFTGEDGEPVALRSIVTAPTLVALVYYHCANECGLLTANLAETLAAVQAEPGRDYRVVTVSIDDREGPPQAREKKAIAMSILGAGFPAGDWRFLTGDARDIDALTDAVGFHFARRGDDFDHPLGLVVLSPAGKIVRYMRGTDFLATDLRLAMMEASSGRVSAAIGKVLRLCLSYDPSSNRLAFDILRAGATVTLAVAAGLAAFVALRSRKRRTREVK
jgi:protein SCO1/2